MKPTLTWRTHNPVGWRQQVAAARLTPLEQWALHLFLDHQWENDVLPLDCDALRALLVAYGLPSKERRKVRVDVIVDHFFPVTADGASRQNAELHDEFERGLERAQKLSARAKKVAKGRWPERKPKASDSPPQELGGLEQLLERIGGAPERITIESLFAALPEDRDPEAWALTFRNFLDGLGTPGGKCCTPEQLAVACTQYLQLADADRSWNPNHVAAFVSKSMRRRDDDVPPPTSGVRGGGAFRTPTEQPLPSGQELRERAERQRQEREARDRVLASERGAPDQTWRETMEKLADPIAGGNA